MSTEQVSDIFDPQRWDPVPGFELTDITYHRARHSGTVRVAFDRPEVRNAFRPSTVDELARVLDHARMTSDVGCVLLTGNGPSPRDGGWAFCSGGDQRIRGKDGYRYTLPDGADGAAGESLESMDPARSGRLHILEVQRLIRFMPKVVICVVPGWAAGGGHSLHVVSDLTLASREHARFKQTDADVASFDGGFGSAYLARQDLALSAHHLRRMHRRVAQPGLLELLSGDLQHAAFAVKLALPHRCDRGREIGQAGHRAASGSPYRTTRRLRIEAERAVHPFGFFHIAAVQRRQQQVARRRNMEPVADQCRDVSL